MNQTGTTSSTIKVVLVDDHDLVRQGVASLLTLDRTIEDDEA